MLRCYTNPTDSTDRPPFLHIYSTIQTAGFADNVLPVMSPFSLTAAFADNVLPVMSPFSPTAEFVDNMLPVLSPFLMTAVCADNVLPVTSPTFQCVRLPTCHQKRRNNSEIHSTPFVFNCHYIVSRHVRINAEMIMRRKYSCERGHCYL